MFHKIHTKTPEDVLKKYATTGISGNFWETCIQKEQLPYETIVNNDFWNQ